MEGNKIKDIYCLQYDRQPYGLPTWYNRLIDKTVDQINIRDVFSMLTNDILPALAIEKAIEFFINDPFDGEAYLGQILEFFVEHSDMFWQSKSSQLPEMLKIIKTMDKETAQSKEQWGYGYDFDECGCAKYLGLLERAKQIIEMKDSRN